MPPAPVPGAGWSYRGASTCFGRLEQVSAHVYSVTEDDRYAERPHLYVCLGTDRVVLVDSGAGTADYYAWLRSGTAVPGLEADDPRPLLLVLTHSHFDHAGGAGSFVDAAGTLRPGVEAVCASAADPDFTKARGAHADTDPWQNRSVGAALRPFAVTRWLQHGETLRLSHDAHLEVLLAPGHTPDSLCLWMPSERRLFTGDLFYPRTTIFLVLPGASVAAARRSLEAVVLHVAGDGEVELSCGHRASRVPDGLAALRETIALLADICNSAAGPGARLSSFAHTGSDVSVPGDTYEYASKRTIPRARWADDTCDPEGDEVPAVVVAVPGNVRSGPT